MEWALDQTKELLGYSRTICAIVASKYQTGDLLLPDEGLVAGRHGGCSSTLVVCGRSSSFMSAAVLRRLLVGHHLAFFMSDDISKLYLQQ